MRRVARLLVLIVAAYGPLAPIVVALLLAIPPLVALSGWAWWIDVAFALVECGLLVGAALWLGPEVLAAIRAFVEEDG